jgi:transposase InsO family protein
LSCEDPVTGLASLAHLQARFAELYRGQLRLRAREDWALVVIDAPGGVETPADRIVEDLLVLRFGEVVRTVFAAGETFGRLARRRVVVLCRRDDLLDRRVAVVRRMLDQLGYTAPRARVLVEELPPTYDGAASLLAELARV